MGLELKYWPQTSQGAQPTLQVNLWFAGMEKDPLNSSTHTPIKKNQPKTNLLCPTFSKANWYILNWWGERPNDLRRICEKEMGEELTVLTKLLQD